MEITKSKEINLFVINQSAILGLIHALFLFMLYSSGKLFSSWENLSFLIWIIFIYVSSIKYRERFLDGFIQMGKAFAYGLRMIVLSGIISGFFYFILLKIDTELAHKQIYTLLDLYAQTGFPESMIEELEYLLLKNFPWFIFLNSILSCFLYGMVVSFVTSIFVRRKREQTNLI